MAEFLDGSAAVGTHCAKGVLVFEIRDSLETLVRRIADVMVRL